MRAKEFIVEYRDKMFQYIKSVLPTWPDYVLRDWIYNLARGDHRTGPGYDPQNPNWKFNRDTILKMVAGAGLSPNTKWILNPRQQFIMDMWEPETRQRLIGRAGGNSDLGMGIPRDKERHATQAALAQQQGGVRKEPVIIIKTAKGYELAEGWHRTIQHFHMYPDGYIGPAYVAVAQGSQGVAEGKTASSSVVYHGNQGGIHRELITPMWWTESKQDAINYARQGGADGWVYSARLTCKNPYVIKPTDETNTVLEKYKQLEKQGYDSIYDSRLGDWIPFNSKDIHLVGKPEYQEGEQDLVEGHWYRGISQKDYDNIMQGQLPQASSVPVYSDNEVSEHLGLSDEDVAAYEQEFQGKPVINLTKDRDNAKGYGDRLLWVDDSLVDLDLSPYGLVALDNLKNSVRWGIE